MAELSSPGFIETFVASGDLNTSQFRFVRLSGPDVYLADSGYATGVLQNIPLNNEHAKVCVLGPTKIQLANSYGPDILIGCGSGGYGVNASGGGTASEGRKYGRLIVGATSGAYGAMVFSDVGTL